MVRIEWLISPNAIEVTSDSLIIYVMVFLCNLKNPLELDVFAVSPKTIEYDHIFTLCEFSLLQGTRYFVR